MQPLAGTRIIEISDRVAGAYCGKLLRDGGAEVIKVEPPDGDPVRHEVACGRRSGGAGPLFSYLAAGKRSVVADARSDGGAALRELIVSADVLVVAATAAGAADMGIDTASVAEANPGCVLVSISDFGWSGPWAEWPATEFTLQAWCGGMAGRGTPERPPIAVGGGMGEYCAGVYAAAAALAARRAVLRGGRGDHVDLSVLEAMVLAMQSFEWLHASLYDLPEVSRSLEVPSIEAARDGWVGISMVTAQQWLDFAGMVGEPELGRITDLQYQPGRWPRRREVQARIRPWFAGRTVAEIVEQGNARRLAVAPLGNGATLPELDHLAAREVFRRNPDGLLEPRPPWRMSGATPAGPARAPAPGEATLDELRSPPRSTSRVEVGRPAAVGMPLDGVRIVDFTAFWAGPSATHLLAALGADVVKVESIQRPDGLRFAGGPCGDAERWWEYSWVFQNVNLDKRAITLDLGSASGRALIERLIAGADAVVENFSPRVMERFGLDYAAVSDVNPDVVMMRMPAFGLDGPWRDRVGFAPTMEQISGMAWRTGYADGPPVAPRGICDPLAGIHGAFCLQLALQQRERTGRGLLLELPMVEVALNVTAQQVLEHQAFGVMLEREGNRGPSAAPQNVYACAGREQWIALAVATDAQWAALRRVLGEPPWSGAVELADHAGRRLHHDLLDRELGAWFAGQERDGAVEALLAAGVPAAPVVLPPEVIGNAQLEARGFFEWLTHPVTGSNRYAGLPFPPFGGVEAWCRNPPPTLGEHNHQVLGGELGLSEEEIGELQRSGVSGDWPQGH